MKVCPNCKKKLTDKFVYCRICGSKLDGSSVGDFSTEVKNLFRDDEGYYYLFAHNGVQQIIRSDSIDEIKSRVVKNHFPWFSGQEIKPKSEDRVIFKPSQKSLFLKISESASKVIPSSLNWSHASSKNAKKPLKQHKPPVKETPKIEFPKPDHLNRAPENPSRPMLVPDELIPKDFGVVGLYRHEHDGRKQWAFKTNETQFPIHNDRLDRLKKEVLSRDCYWEVVDEGLQSDAFELDAKLKERRDAKILAGRKKSSITLKDKIEMKREMAEKRQISKNPEFENLDRMKW